MSPALFRDPNVVPTPKVYGNVRSAVLVYEDAARAKTAFERLGTQAFEDCMVAAVNTYIHSDPPDREPVPDAFDNFRCAALFVARTGTVIVTALAASSGQLLDCGSPSALARRIGVSALARPGKAVRS